MVEQRAPEWFHRACLQQLSIERLRRVCLRLGIVECARLRGHELVHAAAEAQAFSLPTLLSSLSEAELSRLAEGVLWRLGFQHGRPLGKDSLVSRVLEAAGASSSEGGPANLAEVRHRATRNSWPAAPAPEMREDLAVDWRVSGLEAWFLSRGFLPADMDDRWFVFAEGNTCHVHRSWAGHWVGDVHLSPLSLEQWVIGRVSVPSRQGRPENDQDYVQRVATALQVTLERQSSICRSFGST